MKLIVQYETLSIADECRRRLTKRNWTLKLKAMFFILLSSMFLGANGVIFTGCSDALLNDNMENGSFLIKPVESAKIANIIYINIISLVKF